MSPKPPPIIAFWVPGAPVPKQSFKVSGKGGGFTPQRVTDWQDQVRAFCLETMQERGIQKLGGRVAVAMLFIPKDRRIMDPDNMSKAVLDGLKGTLFGDDSQVDMLIIHRRQPNPALCGVAVAASTLPCGVQIIELVGLLLNLVAIRAPGIRT